MHCDCVRFKQPKHDGHRTTQLIWAQQNSKRMRDYRPVSSEAQRQGLLCAAMCRSPDLGFFLGFEI
jgi:hypothetical protein